MPLFDYKCTECETVTEVLQGHGDEELIQCPECDGTDSMERLISPSSFILKGGGWYKDGYSKEAS